MDDLAAELGILSDRVINCLIEELDVPTQAVGGGYILTMGPGVEVGCFNAYPNKWLITACGSEWVLERMDQVSIIAEDLRTVLRNRTS